MKKKFVVIGIAVIGAGTLCGYSFANKVNLISEEVTAELGEQMDQDVSCYANSFLKSSMKNLKLDFSEVDINQIGTYDAYVIDGDNRMEFQVNVKDTKAPEAKVIDSLKFGINDEIAAKDLVTDIEDFEQVTVLFADGTETKTYGIGGTYTENVVLTDEAGNTNTLEVSFKVADIKKPVLKGMKNRTVYVGSKIDYLKDVTATDDVDGDLTSKIEVNSSKVNLSKAGKYKVIYSVSDSAGNTTTKKVKLTVKAKVTTSQSKKSNSSNSSNNSSNTKKSKSGSTKRPTSSGSSSTGSNASSSGSSGFTFHSVEPEGGSEAKIDMKPGGQTNVGTW